MKKTIASVTIALAASVAFAQDFTNEHEVEISGKLMIQQLAEGESPNCPEGTIAKLSLNQSSYTCEPVSTIKFPMAVL